MLKCISTFNCRQMKQVTLSGVNCTLLTIRCSHHRCTATDIFGLQYHIRRVIIDASTEIKVCYIYLHIIGLELASNKQSSEERRISV